MNTKNLLCLVSAIALTTATLGHAQSLAEAAKHEKERRAKIKAAGGSAQLYTENMKSSAAAEEPTAPDSTGAASARPADGTKKKEKTTEELRAEKQQEWAEKLQKTQE